MNNYTEEQIKDIQERISQANQYFKEIQLVPVIQFIPVETKTGETVNSVIVALQDTKYLPEEPKKEEGAAEPELETVIPEKADE